MKQCAVVGCTDAGDPHNLCPRHEAQIKREVERDHEFVQQVQRDEIKHDVEESFEKIKRLRPSHRTVSMWSDMRACLENIRMAEFHLGLLPEKPRGLDLDAVEAQLQDARMAIGQLALALADGVGE